MTLGSVLQKIIKKTSLDRDDLNCLRYTHRMDGDSFCQSDNVLNASRLQVETGKTKIKTRKRYDIQDDRNITVLE